MKSPNPSIRFSYERIPSKVAAVQYKGPGDPDHAKSLRRLEALAQLSITLGQEQGFEFRPRSGGALTSEVRWHNTPWTSTLFPGDWLVLDVDKHVGLVRLGDNEFAAKYRLRARKVTEKEKPE